MPRVPCFLYSPAAGATGAMTIFWRCLFGDVPKSSRSLHSWFSWIAAQARLVDQTGDSRGPNGVQLKQKISLFGGRAAAACFRLRALFLSFQSWIDDKEVTGGTEPLTNCSERRTTAKRAPDKENP